MLAARCQLFMALVVASSAVIAREPELRATGPTFRRFASFAHAAHAHRCLFDPMLDIEPVLDVIVDSLGLSFYISALIDKATLPHWRPLWVTPDHIEADVVGRIHNALARIPSCPVKHSIETVLAPARSRIKATIHPRATMLPGILQGYPATSGSRALPVQVANDLRTSLVTGSPAEACAMAGNAAAIAELPEDTLRLYADAITRLPLPAHDDDWQIFLAQLSEAAHAAAVKRSIVLAETVVDTVFNALQLAKSPPGLDLVLLIVEASAAQPTRAEALTWLGHRLASLASMAQGDLLVSVRLVIDELSALDGSIMQAMSRARSMLRLAA